MTNKSATRTLYDHPSDMEPLLPAMENALSSSALALIRGAEWLRASLHPITRQLVADLVRSMNSYYSNLIEGHRARPRDIDAAIRKVFSADPSQRSLQKQHVAHMEVQSDMEARLPTISARANSFAGCMRGLTGGCRKNSARLRTKRGRRTKSTGANFARGRSVWAGTWRPPAKNSAHSSSAFSTITVR